MQVTVIIPSCSTERIPLLAQAVESIRAGSYKNIRIVIIADGNPSIQWAMKKQDKVTVLFNKKRMDWTFSVNRAFKEFDSDYYAYASDDLIFPSNCIESAVATMKKRFPDGFGLVTISKKNRCPFALIGRKFVEHFPDRQVFCPDFVHYGGDTEMMRMVRKLGIFAYPPNRESQVRHSRMKDETWRIARRVRGRDGAIHAKRLEKGYIWGVDFNLVKR